MFNSIITSLNNNNNKYNDFNNELCFKELEELEQTIDWDDLVADVFPYYVKSKICPASLTIENMLRVCIILRHFNMSPARVKKALSKNNTLREFALINLKLDAIPSVSCIRNFNSLLLKKDLALKFEQALQLKTSLEF